jgi:hypothetical protein
MGRETVVTASALAAMICSTSLFGAAAQTSSIGISQEQLKASEIDGPNHQRIKICALSALSFVNGQITSLDIECQNRRMRLDPSNFTVELAKNGQIIISIPYTEPETKMLLGLEQPAPAYPSVIQGNSITTTEKR